MADKEYNKTLIPRYAPTWRYYATKKELKAAGAEKGPKLVRINNQPAAHTVDVSTKEDNQ
jgi:hypothetical protein